MTSDAAALAVLLRKAHWLLDDVAYEVAAGRSEAVDLSEVARVLEGVAAVLRSGEDAASPLAAAGSDLPGTPLASVDPVAGRSVVRLERDELGEVSQLSGLTTPRAIDSSLVASFRAADGEDDRATGADPAHPSDN